MKNSIFITGTNTDVGKTYIGIKLLKELNKKKDFLAFKPIETGCQVRKGLLIPRDSTKYYHALGKKITLDEINPYRFIEPVSPYLAIKNANKKIYIKDYIMKYKKIIQNRSCVIEGAGGAFSPLATDGLNINLMKKIKSFNILVVKDELGCIGAAVSTMLAFERLKTSLDLVILNSNNKNQMENFKEIKKHSKIPVVNYTSACSIKMISKKIFNLL